MATRATAGHVSHLQVYKKVEAGLSTDLGGAGKKEG